MPGPGVTARTTAAMRNAKNGDMDDLLSGCSGRNGDFA
jgi:hypothetical protein